VAIAAPPGGLARLGGRLRDWLLDELLPPSCPSCRRETAAHGELCAACWGRLRLLEPPWCARCGWPGGGAEQLACPGCAGLGDDLDRVRAALAYGTEGRRLILGLKYRARFQAVPVFATWLLRAGRELLTDVDLILPVPLHRWRLLQRGYNQSALLAGELARRAGLACRHDVLRKTRATRSQQGLGAAARARNVTAVAFAVATRHQSCVRGRSLLLVDDVLTTGTTLGACARTLKRAGAARVDALALARVVAGDGDPIC
jgi:ComF family protein